MKPSTFSQKIVAGLCRTNGDDLRGLALTARAWNVEHAVSQLNPVQLNNLCIVMLAGSGRRLRVLSASSSDKIFYSQLAEKFGVQLTSPNWTSQVCGLLFRVIVSLVEKKFPERVPSSVIAAALELDNPGNARWESDIKPRIDELQRLARAAAMKQPVESPVATLSAMTANTASDDPWLDRASLALALDLFASSSVDAVLNRLEQIAVELWPELTERKALADRLSLVGLS